LISQHLKGEKYAELCELALEKVGHSAIKLVAPQWLQDHVDPSEQGDRLRVDQDPSEQQADRYFNIAKAAMQNETGKQVRDVLKSVNEHLEHFKDDLSHVRGEKYIELCRLAVTQGYNTSHSKAFDIVKLKYFVKKDPGQRREVKKDPWAGLDKKFKILMNNTIYQKLQDIEKARRNYYPGRNSGWRYLWFGPEKKYTYDETLPTA